MMNNGIKSMTNYANNYPPHINAIQQMVTQVITIPYQHTTCHCFSQFFSQALCASSHFFSHYAFDIHQHFVLLLFFSWPLATFYSFSLQALGLFFFFTMQHAFSNHTTIQEQWKCKYMLWMHVSKLVKVEEKKVMAQRGETKDIFVG